jgi:hypothetical protein
MERARWAAFAGDLSRYTVSSNEFKVSSDISAASGASRRLITV